MGTSWVDSPGGVQSRHHAPASSSTQNVLGTVLAKRLPGVKESGGHYSMRLRSILTILAIVTLMGAVEATADTVLVPYAGAVTGGDIDERHTTYGAGINFLGDGPFGFELDLGYTPDFYGDEASFGSKNNVTTLMGNLMLGVPLGREARIYAAGGAGLLKSRVNDVDDFFDVDRNDFAVNVGGGILGFLGDHFGVRGDVRYFRNITDPEPDGGIDLELGGFHFWRVTAGIAYRF